MFSDFLLILIISSHFRDASFAKNEQHEEVESEAEGFRPTRDACVLAVDVCLRGKLRNGEVSGYNEEDSQLAVAACSETHNCSISKQRLCYSFRFEKLKKPWMEQKCSKWGATIPPYEVLPDY